MSVDKKGSRSKYMLLAVSLVAGIPLSLFLVAKITKKDKLAMPVYYKADEKIESHKAMKMVRAGELKPIAELEAYNQFGDKVSLNKDLPGKMLAINFIFTSCTSTCPVLTQQMKRLEYAFRKTPMKRNDTMVQFISISVDPQVDSASVLRAYAEAAGVDQNRWWFITGDKRMLYNWARNQLHLSVPAGDGGADDFIHTNQIVLVDRDRFIRGYYDGLDTGAVIRCANDMGLLAMEKKR
jgi:protein SCO1